MSRRFRRHLAYFKSKSSSVFPIRVSVTWPCNHSRLFTYLTMEKTFRSSEAPMHPQLRLMRGGAVLVVQFGDAIAFCSRGPHLRAPTCLLV
jgi:hypothetical protein